MKLLFWLSLALVVYTFFGYPVLLWLRARVRQCPVFQRAITPSVSIVVAARNEELNLPRKLKSLRAMDYPKEQVQIVVASDGSTDRTAAILREHEPEITPVLIEQTAGKAHALNEAVRRATGEILVF